MTTRLITRSAGETRALGEQLGQAIAGPLLLLLRGDYGTGKTTFVQGLAAGLGSAEPVRSPSYLIVRVHEGTTRQLVHADLYRTGSTAEVAELGLAELAGEGGVIAIEWPGAAAAIREPCTPLIELSFSYVDGAGREAARLIEIEWQVDLPGELVEVLRAAVAG